MRRIVIKFVRHYSCYMEGETAQFPKRVADILIHRCYAVAVVPQIADDAARLKNLASAPETKHIPGPQNTKSEQAKAVVVRKCGSCGQPGHTKASCPKK